MDKIEIVCLSGLEEAVLGYQVGLDQATALVYDYEKTVMVLEEHGYSESDINDFFGNLSAAGLPGNAPVFVKIDPKLRHEMSEETQIIFDDKERTIH